MTVVAETNFFGAVREKPRLFSAAWARRLGLFALIGFLQLLVNFPKFLSTTIDANVSNEALRAVLHAPIQAVQFLVGVLVGQAPTQFFERAATCAFLLFWTFLALLAVFCLRRGGYRMSLYSVAGMATGYIAVHILSWFAVMAAMAIGGVLYVARWVLALIGAIFQFLIQGPVMLTILAAIVLLTAYIFRSAISAGASAIVLRFGKMPIRIATTVAVLVASIVAAPYIYRWIILPIIKLLGMIVGLLFEVAKWLFLAIAIILGVGLAAAVTVIGLACLGSLLVSQIQAGWHAARSLRLMLVAGFAIGSSFALLVLVSLGTPAIAESLNQSVVNPLTLFGAGERTTTFITDTFVLSLPGSVQSFVFTHLTNLQAPAFDCFVFLAVMVLASSSLFFRVFSAKPVTDEVVPLTFVVQEYALMALGLLVGLLVVFLQGLSGDSSA